METTELDVTEPLFSPEKAAARIVDKNKSLLFTYSLIFLLLLLFVVSFLLFMN